MKAQPFEIRFDTAAVEHLRQRVRSTQWAPERHGASWELGVPGVELRRLAARWADGFDFAALEARLNRVPHFRANIDGVDIHFVHRRGVGPSPMPLVLTHGWPWSFWDYSKVIEPLADPARFGGDAADAFDVVVPALPGFPFSSPPDRPIGFVETADLWRHLLIDALSYPRFGAHGGDSGAFVTAQLAHAHADVLVGAHLTFPALLGASLGDARERPELQTHFLTHIFEPQTLSWAMHDSPVGMLAWMLHRRRSWSDCNGDVSRRFSDDELLLTTTLYWLGDSFASSLRFYADSFKKPWTPRVDGIPTLRAPTGIAVFPQELRRVPKILAQEHANLVHWTEMPRGGHFAAGEEPELLIEDLRAFFRPLRSCCPMESPR
jgi:pimeloyl-ACP methyl ester carboxylesterase